MHTPLLTALPVNLETLVPSNFGRWFNSEILLLLSDFFFLSLSAPLPPPHPFFSHSVFFFFLYFPLPVNEKNPQNISSDTHPTLCAAREGQVEPKVLAALRHWGQGGGQHLGQHRGGDKDLMEPSRSEWGMLSGCYGYTPAGNTSPCSWNCEP